MSAASIIGFTVNEKEVEVSAAADTPLIYVLRNDLAWTIHEMPAISITWRAERCAHRKFWEGAEYRLYLTGPRRLSRISCGCSGQRGRPPAIIRHFMNNPG